MSKLRNAGEKSAHLKSVEDISSVISRTGAVSQSQSIADDVIGLESLDSSRLSSVQASFKEVEASLRETDSFGKWLAGKTKEQQEFALEAAAMTIMAGGNPSAWHSAAKAPVGGAGIVLANPNQGTLDYSNDYAIEGFESGTMNQFIAQSAYVNAMAAVQGGFEEAFFPIQIVPAGTTGVDVTISIPKVFSVLARTSTGAPVTFNKINIIKAIVDSTVLENNATKVVPVVGNSATLVVQPAVMVLPDVIIDGATVSPAPVVFDKEVDLISISTTPAMVGQTLNETDTLDSVINVGKLYFKVDIDGDDAVFGFDISNQAGSLLQRSAEGTDRGFQTTFIAKFVVTKDSSAILPSTFAALEAQMLTAEKLVGSVRISAIANTEYGTMSVTASMAKIDKAYDVDGVEIALPGVCAVTMLGYMPAARRTNANIRSRGTIIDSTTAVVYRFPVPLQSPIISQQPLGGAVNTSIEGLAHAEHIRNSNNAVKTLLALEEVLAADNGLPIGMPTMGAEMVQPTYYNSPLDMEGIVVRMASKDSMDDLRGALSVAVMTVTNKLLQDSQYLAAVEFNSGNNQDYEVLIVTDSVLYPWLMEAGDSRTLGANRKFKITQSLNSSMIGKIYISFRRATRDGQLSPLDFGAFLYTPALTHEVQVSRAGATVKEIHTIPRNAYYCTLPILGRIDVTNVLELFNR